MLGAPTTAHRKLDALTGMRFFLAAYVVVFHLAPLEDAPRMVRSFLSNAPVAVSVFFVLSGFVLTYTYAPQQAIALGKFWRARFARIYPIYFLAILIQSPIAFLVRPHPPRALPTVLTLLLLQDWTGFARFTWNTPAWSLSAEAFFYLVFPFLLPWFKRASRKAIVWWCLAFIVFRIGSALTYLALRPDGGTLAFNQDRPWFSTFAFLPLMRLPEFLVGMCLGRLYLGRDIPLTRATRSLLCWGSIVVAIAVASTNPAEWAERIWARDLLIPSLLLPATSIAVYTLASEVRLLSNLLSRPSIVLLGEASYALYILHVPLTAWGVILLDHATPQHPEFQLWASPWMETWIGTAVTLVVLSLISVLSFLYIERRMRVWLAGPRPR